MSGITGMYYFDGRAGVDKERLMSVTALLQRSQPVGSDVFVDRNVGLSGTLPAIVDKTGKYALVVDGEIYNTADFKVEITDAGLAFSSLTNAQVLLYLLIKYKEKALDKVNGSFAFVFYDAHENSCLAARDHFGCRPFYFYHDEAAFYFASQLRTLAGFGRKLRLDNEALYLYLQLNYLPPDVCILRNINKLQPGCYLKISAGGVEQRRYYQVSQAAFADDLPDYAAACRRLRELLEASVRKCMSAAAPLGCFLSGGIDSSVITALAAQCTPHLNTFSVGFADDAFFDETPFAELAAKKFNTNHTSFKIAPDDLLHDIQNLLDNIDEPFADSSVLALNALCKLTRSRAAVVLSGDGADEMFAGYNKHSAHYRMLSPSSTEKIAVALGPLWKVAFKSRNSKLANTFRRLNRFVSAYHLSPENRYWAWASIGNDAYAATMLKNVADKRAVDDVKTRYTAPVAAAHNLNGVLCADMQLVLPGDMLTKVNVAANANNIAVRPPFIDRQVVDYAFSLPWQFKIEANNRKRILKDAFVDMLPAELLNRRKHGFEVPLLHWLRHELKSTVDDDLLERHFIEEQGIFNYQHIARLKKKLRSADPDDAPAKIWALIVFQKWWRNTLI